jgi:cytochrome c-type biogenesis protein CcmF
MTTTEAALLTRGFSQLYISLGDVNADGAVGGAHLSQAAGAADLVRHAVMAFGGLLSLSDRRLRVGAPKPAKSAGLVATGRMMKRAHSACC